MERNEIIKALYKQKPMTDFKYIRIGVAYYSTILEDATHVDFEVPVNDMGSADFFPQMEAKHMIRWIVDYVES